MVSDGKRDLCVRGRSVQILGFVAAGWLMVGSLAPLSLAKPTDPSRNDERIAIMVSALMDRKHLSEMQVNDVISRRTLDMYLKSLDRMKLFFLQSDVDEFAANQDKLDDLVKQGDVHFAKQVFDRFLQRVHERVAVAQKLVDQPHDFTVDEDMIRDPDKTEYAKTVEELDERWRKRVKYDLLLEIADDVSPEETIEKLHKRYRGIEKNWEQHSNDELLEDFLSALTMSFDPHSNYMSPSTLDNFTIQMRLELDGIGASLESKYGDTIVRRIVPGGAADKDDRLKVEDVIVGVGEGTDGEFVDIVDMKINDVVQMIRGKPGTIVRLEVMPADKSERQVYDITRARIELKDSEARSEILERPQAKTDEKDNQFIEDYVKFVLFSIEQNSHTVDTDFARTIQADAFSSLKKELSANSFQLNSDKYKFTFILGLATTPIAKKATPFVLGFNQSLKFQRCKSQSIPEKIIYKNTQIVSLDNQIFIVTRLPRGSIDSLLK